MYLKKLESIFSVSSSIEPKVILVVNNYKNLLLPFCGLTVCSVQIISNIWTSMSYRSNIYCLYIQK